MPDSSKQTSPFKKRGSSPTACRRNVCLGLRVCYWDSGLLLLKHDLEVSIVCLCSSARNSGYFDVHITIKPFLSSLLRLHLKPTISVMFQVMIWECYILLALEGFPLKARGRPGWGLAKHDFSCPSHSSAFRSATLRSQVPVCRCHHFVPILPLKNSFF